MIPSKRFDRRFAGVGRLAVFSGTTDRKLFAKMDAMLTDLHESGRLDILRAVKAGELAPLEVWTAYRAKDLGSLALGPALKPLHMEYEAWRVRATKNAKSLASRKQSGVYLWHYGAASSRVADLPEILLKARTKMEAEGHAVSFNRLKSAAQAFVRDTLGKASTLYRDVTGVQTLEEVTTVDRRPMTPGVFAREAAKLDQLTRDAAWCMITTGMGPSEYFETPWEVTPAYVHIHGTKRAARDRVVPALGYAHRVPVSRGVFEKRLVKAGAPFKPYDLRRSYANWLEAAGINPTRVRLYMGHAARDVTDLYLAHAVLPYLDEDAAKLRAYIERELARPVLALEKAE